MHVGAPVLVLEGESVTLGVTLEAGVVVMEGVVDMVGVGGSVRVKVHPGLTTVPSETHYNSRNAPQAPHTTQEGCTV